MLNGTTWTREFPKKHPESGNQLLFVSETVSSGGRDPQTESSLRTRAMIIPRYSTFKDVVESRVAKSMDGNDQILVLCYSRHGVVATWLNSERPGSVVALSETFVCWEHITSDNENVLEKIGKVVCAYFLPPY
jgi:hypothetical protein